MHYTGQTQHIDKLYESIECGVIISLLILAIGWIGYITYKNFKSPTVLFKI